MFNFFSSIDLCSYKSLDIFVFLKVSHKITFYKLFVEFTSNLLVSMDGESLSHSYVEAVSESRACNYKVWSFSDIMTWLKTLCI